MQKELKNMSRSQLLSLRDDIDTALETLAVKEKQQALEAAEKAAQSFGYSLTELTGKKSGKQTAKAKLPAKYQNPDDNSATWSGRGRQPEWFKNAISSGKSPEELEI